MRHFLAFLILAAVKTFCHLFYRADFKWITPHPKNPWKEVRLIVLLNHTSLFEPLYIRAFSYRYLWYLSQHLNVPGADITLNRKYVGKFWKMMVPGIASVSRKQDSTWSSYLEGIKDSCVIMIAPEGRMKRPTGFDKSGKPMTVKIGIADIIEDLDQGGMLLALSGGLHHIQKPGQHFPKLFKPIKMNMAYLDIAEFKASFTGSVRERKLAMVADLQKRLEKDCPTVMV